MISKKSEELLNRAGRLAFEKTHEYCTLEHVLLVFLDDAGIQDVLENCEANIPELRSALEAFLDKEVPKAKKVVAPSENTPEDEEGDGDTMTEPPVATLGIQRLIQRAVFHVQSSGKDEVEPKDLLVAFFQAKDSHALYLLQKQNIKRLDVLNFISHGVSKAGTTSEASSNDAEERPKSENDEKAEAKAKGETEVLQQFCVNLNDYAARGKSDPLVGRKSELDRMIQILCRRRKNNPLLVGEAGVGKTALAEGLAFNIVHGQVPDVLKNSEVYSLDLGSLLAGARFRGDFEQRLKRVLNTLISKKAKGASPILFIDEIHTIIGAGAVSGGALDAANLLKPFLSRGEIQCIGSTTYNEYRTIFEKDHALSRRFQKLEVQEPSVEDCILILKGLKPKFEEHHKLEYTDESLRAATELSVKHLSERFLPDKALDLIDEAGSRARLAGGTKVDVAQVEETLSQIARIPSRSVNSNQKQRLKSLDKDLKLMIFGQDAAIDAVVTAIRLNRSGLSFGEKPVGSFLFCGPTGVGKTELAKQLAHQMGVPFQRFDMSEYMEKHTVSRLIGAPPGYVGFEQAGMLTENVRKSPYSVVLLDEIEKAHPDVWNILLQVMDHGSLTDNNGRKADFRNIVLIMTSNVGAREMELRPIGMSSDGADLRTPHKEVERTFSPEFRNRLDAIVYFNKLDPVTIAQVVGKQLVELEAQLLAKNVEIEFTPEVREWIAQKGYDRVMGARPLARFIQEELRKPLSEMILFGVLEHGGSVFVELDGEKLKFTCNGVKQGRAVSNSTPVS